MYQNTIQILAHAVNDLNFTCTASREKVIAFANSVTQLMHAFSCETSSYDSRRKFGKHCEEAACIISLDP